MTLSGNCISVDNSTIDINYLLGAESMSIVNSEINVAEDITGDEIGITNSDIGCFDIICNNVNITESILRGYGSSYDSEYAAATINITGPNTTNIIDSKVKVANISGVELNITSSTGNVYYIHGDKINITGGTISVGGISDYNSGGSINIYECIFSIGSISCSSAITIADSEIISQIIGGTDLSITTSTINVRDISVDNNISITGGTTTVSGYIGADNNISITGGITNVNGHIGAGNISIIGGTTNVEGHISSGGIIKL